MGTWATWMFTRFERVKVCVYRTFIQGLEAYPTQGITLLISPQCRTDTRQSRGGKGTVRVASYGPGSVTRLVAKVATFLLCPLSHLRDLFFWTRKRRARS